MRRGRSYYRVPSVTDESFRSLNDYRVSLALKICFGEKVESSRTVLIWCGIPQTSINNLTDKQVKQYDLHSWAFEVLRELLVALVQKENERQSIQ